MTNPRLILLTAFAMIPLAANSWLCRAALRDTAIDAASFTSIRLISGALMLWLLVWLTGKTRAGVGNWPSAFALFGYAALFSFAYLSLTAATGALLLFGAVQVTMIGLGLRSGERLDGVQIIGVALAFGGLVGLLMPGLSAPPLGGALMMIGAGMAWGVYSVRGKGAGDPIRVTAGNFLLTVPITALLSLLTLAAVSVDALGAGYAVASGALTSALGYALWYRVLPLLRSTSAATVQLSVPVIVAIGGVALLGEPITLRLVLASAAVLGGIALVILERDRVRGRR
ncbi:DMT family transporter [Thiocapsa bogorovii]|uniref:DMT family transporter n=1 Tax=Thiocapsa bogorovii TaxID=521689 RepID=UPI001E4EBC78|nr:DMT family transporter [Thiocapsa bogorovii]UHD14713.1 DMT family transporter [Thiocapsa bogorovii]